MPGKSQQGISTQVSLTAFSEASDFSQASWEHAAKNGTFGGPSVWGPHEDRDFFQAVTFLLSQSIRGERGRILGGDLPGPKMEPQMNSGIVFMWMNFEQSGQDFVPFCPEICWHSTVILQLFKALSTSAVQCF